MGLFLVGGGACRERAIERSNSVQDAAIDVCAVDASTVDAQAAAAAVHAAAAAPAASVQPQWPVGPFIVEPTWALCGDCRLTVHIASDACSAAVHVSSSYTTTQERELACRFSDNRDQILITQTSCTETNGPVDHHVPWQTTSCMKSRTPINGTTDHKDAGGLEFTLARESVTFMHKWSPHAAAVFNLSQERLHDGP